MLTSKQAKLLDYLTNTLKDNNISPSFDEMRKFLGLSSKSGVHRLISSLEERGFIKRLHNKARAIKIIKKNIFKKGDIIFWKGHVAICLNSKKLIHAYGPEKKVLMMPIFQTIKRIEETAKLKVKKISYIKY